MMDDKEKRKKTLYLFFWRYAVALWSLPCSSRPQGCIQVKVGKTLTSGMCTLKLILEYGLSCAELVSQGRCSRECWILEPDDLRYCTVLSSIAWKSNGSLTTISRSVVSVRLCSILTEVPIQLSSPRKEVSITPLLLNRKHDTFDTLPLIRPWWCVALRRISRLVVVCVCQQAWSIFLFNKLK